MVIPCGGLATRLGTLAKNVPKSMMNINGKTFLELQIELIKKNGFDELILCTGHLGEKIRDYFGDGGKFGIKIRYSNDKKLGVIGAIKNAEKMLDDFFFLMYGDSYLIYLDFNDMFNKFKDQKRLSMIAVWKNNNNLDKSNFKIKNGKILGIDVEDSNYIDYGTTIMNKKVLDFIPRNRAYSTLEFRKMLFEKKELAIYEVDKRFYHIGTVEALEEVRSLSKQQC